MKSRGHPPLALLILLIGSVQLLAQPRQPTPEAAAGAACASCGVCGGGVLFVLVAVFVLNIALLVWVARDAKARAMDSSVLWMILVMITGPIGLILYLFSKPQGNLVQCAHCGNKRLQASAKCPHCGNA
jgi:hypothetical protein